MKKNLIVLLVVALVSVGLFAVDSVGFDVKTTVEAINLMKITAAEFTGTTAALFASADPYVGNDDAEDGNHYVSGGGSQTITAWLSTLSNRRTGYKVTMSATAMESAPESGAKAYINYTVTVNSQAITTTGATPAASKEIFSTGAQTGITPQSYQISLSVDPDDFAAAVEGDYTGTVTFAWTAT
jgi:hypothetical protein